MFAVWSGIELELSVLFVNEYDISIPKRIIFLYARCSENFFKAGIPEIDYALPKHVVLFDLK